MKKRIKQILQRIQQYQQQIKNHKISLLEKYKHYHGDKNHDYTKNTTAYNYNTTHSKTNYISDISHQLKQDVSEKAYKRNIKNKYEIKRKQIYDWVAAIEPTHFLTLQFPLNMRSPNLDISKNHLRRFMARFEQHLIGSRWTAKPVNFYVFAEKGRYDGYNYHFHILLHCVRYSDELIEKALDSACLDLSLSPQTYYIEKVEDNEVIHYCLKDIKTFDKTDWYDRIIPSNILFGL